MSMMLILLQLLIDNKYANLYYPETLVVLDILKKHGFLQQFLSQAHT